MLLLALIFAIGLSVFLFGTLVVALVVTTRHGDPTASYKLFAVRDALVGAVVFGGVRRNNPWLEALYDNVNSILLHSNLVSGPERWPIAVLLGRYEARRPGPSRNLVRLQDELECPNELRPVRHELQAALRHLLGNHMGIFLQISARQREERRIQREKAKRLLSMIDREEPACVQGSAR